VIVSTIPASSSSSSSSQKTVLSLGVKKMHLWQRFDGRRRELKSIAGSALLVLVLVLVV
jgi:hypothetical protein